jgi:hypothetical protein
MISGGNSYQKFDASFPLGLIGLVGVWIDLEPGKVYHLGQGSWVKGV